MSHAPADEMERPLREACGIFGIFGHEDAARITYLGLYALQHRGQESAGIVISDGKHLTGLPGHGAGAGGVHEEQLKKLKGDRAIGHVRYSTTGSSEIKNAQPFQVEYLRGSLAIAHNGNLVNTLELKRALEKTGRSFSPPWTARSLCTSSPVQKALSSKTR